MKKLKAAIIGAGTFGSFHAQVYSDIPYVETVAICARNKEHAEKVAAKYQIPQVYTDYHELLEKSGCDFVSIVTPDFLHAQIAVDAANAGKHFLVEKPFATKKEDLYKMVEAIDKNGIRAMCDFHNRSSQPFAMTKAEIATGKYGNIRSMYIRMNDNISVPTNMLSWASNSSALWFLGSHSLDLLCFLSNSRPKTVYTMASSGVLKSMGVDTVDVYQTSIEFENGAIAQMENGWIIPNGNTTVFDLKCSITCENGSFSINASDSDMYRIITDERLQTPNCLSRPMINGHLVGLGPSNIRCFTDGLFLNQPFNITVEEAVDNSLALLSIHESAEKKRPVDVSYLL